MSRRLPRLLLIPLALSLAVSASLDWVPEASAEQPPTPSLTRVRYDNPAPYTALDARFGDTKALQSLVVQLRGSDSRATLRSLWLWTRRNLRPEQTASPSWRSVSEMIQKGTRTGEAEGALALGVLARAAGIPTVWVKTVDVAWIRAGADMAAIRERTFLEVHLSGKWLLLDPTNLRLYDRYDPRAQMLPGDRIAFDKGGDPYALVLPNRAALYAAQVKGSIAKFDVRRLPWGSSEDLLAPIKVFIGGARPISRYVKATCESMGYLVEETFTARTFEDVWPTVKGRLVIVTTEGGKTPHVPEAWRARVLPTGYAALLKEGADPKTFLIRRFQDGTRVIFTAAQSYPAVEVAIARALSELAK